MYNIVLVEPEIPQNTGNISRTCAVTGTRLHLVRPLGFTIDDKQLKRAGLDYWKDLDLTYYDSFEELEEKNPNARFFLFSTHAKRVYTEVSYRDGDFLVFGRETAGLGESLLARRADDAVRIPMKSDQRSLNLSNSVALALYEALRQTGFAGLS
ncbi:MAG: tRNA (uridine(34)/cytosine(34)/5-carboxymethylaminomethyluridine(34)-2'-O)-methyltransferase TrmL [Clostridiaceae bacterium]|nr:tRNA (uridine(34)/cytosine(34)/5-carboxymethylaminomethyluridine(34)-2'-O)-methyltransferase TrmL [Eubacteriales bacterium]